MADDRYWYNVIPIDLKTDTLTWDTHALNGDGAYLISSVKDLLIMAEEMNQYKYPTRTYMLTADIDLSEHLWSPPQVTKEPIETYDPSVYAWYGIFEGSNHTITGMRIKSNGLYPTGFIARTGREYNNKHGYYQPAIIRNVTFKDSVITGSAHHPVGIVAGIFRGKLSNVHATNPNINISCGTSSRVSVGGLIGTHAWTKESGDDNTIDSCSCIGGSITAKNAMNVGGLIGNIRFGSSAEAHNITRSMAALDKIEISGYVSESDNKIGDITMQSVGGLIGECDLGYSYEYIRYCVVQGSIVNNCGNYSNNGVYIGSLTGCMFKRNTYGGGANFGTIEKCFINKMTVNSYSSNLHYDEITNVYNTVVDRTSSFKNIYYSVKNSSNISQSSDLSAIYIDPTAYMNYPEFQNLDGGRLRWIEFIQFILNFNHIYKFEVKNDSISYVSSSSDKMSVMFFINDSINSYGANNAKLIGVTNNSYKDINVPIPYNYNKVSADLSVVRYLNNDDPNNLSYTLESSSNKNLKYTTECESGNNLYDVISNGIIATADPLKIYYMWEIKVKSKIDSIYMTTETGKRVTVDKIKVFKNGSWNPVNTKKEYKSGNWVNID